MEIFHQCFINIHPQICLILFNVVSLYNLCNIFADKCKGRLISFGSKALTDVETSYSLTEKRLISINNFIFKHLSAKNVT